MNIDAAVGSSISLTFLDSDGNFIENNFNISGIFAEYVYLNEEKFLKNNYNDTEDDDNVDLAYPEIYVSDEFAESFYSEDSFGVFSNVVAFDMNITSDYDDYTLYTDIADNKGELSFYQQKLTGTKKSCHHSQLINDFVLEWSNGDTESANTKCFNNIEKRILNKSYLKDLFTFIILPVLAVSIIIITLCSTFISLRISILNGKKRKHNLMILGVSKKQLLISYITEIYIYNFIISFWIATWKMHI
jgi:hypothetical protein